MLIWLKISCVRTRGVYSPEHNTFGERELMGSSVRPRSEGGCPSKGPRNRRGCSPNRGTLRDKEGCAADAYAGPFTPIHLPDIAGKPIQTQRALLGTPPKPPMVFDVPGSFADPGRWPTRVSDTVGKSPQDGGRGRKAAGWLASWF